MRLTLETLHLYCNEEGDCLLWKLGVSSAGMPCARIDGERVSVRRWVYERLMQKQVKSGARVTCRCNNRLCIAPGCLIQMTGSQIVARSYRNGSRGGFAEYLVRRQAHIARGKTKLNAEKAQEIRALQGVKASREVAKQYGVDKRTVTNIWSGETWRLPSALGAA